MPCQGWEEHVYSSYCMTDITWLEINILYKLTNLLKINFENYVNMFASFIHIKSSSQNLWYNVHVEIDTSLLGKLKFSKFENCRVWTTIIICHHHRSLTERLAINNMTLTFYILYCSIHYLTSLRFLFIFYSTTADFLREMAMLFPIAWTHQYNEHLYVS